MTSSAIGVLGAGSWGTALAIQLARNGHRTFLWGHRCELIDKLKRDGRNERYLPGVSLPDALIPESDLGAVAASCRDLVIVVPSEAFAETLNNLLAFITPQHRVVSATKGFEKGSGRLLHEVFEDVFAQQSFAVLSGPTFAKEVAAGMPTAVTVASNNTGFADEVARVFHGETFRVYTSDDVVGVEVGGAVKNVYAVAAGISDGLGFGSNARAALITRALAEMIRIGEALGGRRETLMGLAGIGDLVLTCTDDQSRNRRFGLAVGRGESLQVARQRINQVVEGYSSAREVHARAIKLNLELPIAEKVYDVLYNNMAALDAVRLLLGREPTSESI